MKQFSSSELNNLSKADLAAMVLQMQQQINTLNEKIAIMNARHFGRSTEKLDTLPGQMSVFNEAEAAAAEAVAEPAIEQVVVRRKKQKGQRKEDLSRLPVRVENHELTKEQLKEIYGEKWWKRLPDECTAGGIPAYRQGSVEHHVAQYAAKRTMNRIVRADRRWIWLSNSNCTPLWWQPLMNAKYTKPSPCTGSPGFRAELIIHGPANHGQTGSSLFGGYLIGVDRLGRICVPKITRR